jgi:hypothetical protein
VGIKHVNHYREVVQSTRYGKEWVLDSSWLWQEGYGGVVTRAAGVSRPAVEIARIAMVCTMGTEQTHLHLHL